MNVAVIGASDQPERYSYMAIQLLKEKGHKPFGVHKRIRFIHDVSVYPSITDIPEEVDTVTLYVSADISNQITHEILSKKPRRIIFNPGAENPNLQEMAESKGIQTVNACTLVMLKTGRF